MLRSFGGLSYDNNRFELGAGTYTLSVRGTTGSGGTGDYAVRLIDLGAATDLALGTETLASLANDTAAYRFAAAAGDEVVFEAIAASGVSGYWRLLRPDGSEVQVASSGLGSSRGGIILDRSGSHLLLLEGSVSDAQADTYRFRVEVAGGVTAAADFNTPVSGSIDRIAQQDSYTFTLAETGLVQFDSRTNTSGLQWWPARRRP